MKKYALFPGCSLEKMAASYLRSSVETTKQFGIELQELEDWNCCGATTYSYIDELLANTLVARNLAIAEKAALDFVALVVLATRMPISPINISKKTPISPNTSIML